MKRGMNRRGAEATDSLGGSLVGLLLIVIVLGVIGYFIYKAYSTGASGFDSLGINDLGAAKTVCTALASVALGQSALGDSSPDAIAQAKSKYCTDPMSVVSGNIYATCDAVLKKAGTTGNTMVDCTGLVITPEIRRAFCISKVPSEGNIEVGGERCAVNTECVKDLNGKLENSRAECTAGKTIVTAGFKEASATTSNICCI